MDFNANRGGRQPHQTANDSSEPARPTGSVGSSSSTGHSTPSKGSKGGGGKFSNFLNLKFASIALLFSATVLVVALLAFIVVGTPNNESGFVEDDKYQAVFLNGGQVYFGQVTDLNQSYLRLVDIYYLRVNQQVQPAEGEEAQVPTGDDISLVKLGCELHGPKDEMLINRDQMIFWENLKDDGQVVEAIAAFRAENPDGQDCEVPADGANVQEQQPAPAPAEEGAPAPEEDDELDF